MAALVTTPNGILAASAKRYGLKVVEVTGPRRSRWHVSARRDAARAMREHCPYMSLASIGEVLGGRDHSTVLNLLKESP